MKLIVQEDSLGCSVACVASITKKTYKYTKRKYFKNSNSAKTKGYICKEIVGALEKAGLVYKYKYLKKRMKYKVGTIVFVKRSKRYPAGHFLVKTRRGWMDPWYNFDAKSPDAKRANAGYRKRLPGRAIYAIYPI
tara:strand:+ start:145 stop:549 length:405 start_codon:yes stop_codon:yes gene_type:complete